MRSAQLRFISVLCGVVGVAAGCGGQGGTPSTEDPGGGAAQSPTAETTLDPYSFSDLAQGVATADLVVEGTVTDVEAAGSLGGDGADDPGAGVEGESDAEAAGGVKLMRVTLAVDQQFQPEGSPETIQLIESGAYAPASVVGDHGVYLLRAYPGFDNAFGLANSQSRFLETDDGSITPSDASADWARSASANGIEGLRAEVEAAVAKVQAGGVEPAKPVFGAGSD